MKKIIWAKFKKKISESSNGQKMTVKDLAHVSSSS